VKPGKTKRKWYYFGIVVQEPDTNSLEPCRTYNLCSEASVYHTWKKLIQSTHRHRRNTAQDPFQQRNVVLNLIKRFETKHKKRVQVVQTEDLDKIVNAIQHLHLKHHGDERKELAEKALVAYRKVRNRSTQVVPTERTGLLNGLAKSIIRDKGTRDPVRMLESLVDSSFAFQS